MCALLWMVYTISMENKPQEKSSLQKAEEAVAATVASVVVSKGKKKNTTLAAIAYLLFFVPLLGNEKDDPFIQFHVQQGLGLLLFALIVQGAVSFLLGLGMGPKHFLVWPAGIFLLFELFQGMVHAYRGEWEPLPFLGKYAARLYDLKNKRG